MNSVKEILDEMKKLSSEKTRARHAYFGIEVVNSYGLTTPQSRALAKKIGPNHRLALELWKSNVHEARHIATMIAEPKLTTEALMEEWCREFYSWDLVDGCCSSLFRKTPYAYAKAMEWSAREKEFEKRAGFTMMAQLAVHDKKATDAEMERFLPVLVRESADERNFVRKAVNWALRQIGKRNERLCKKALRACGEMQKKGDASSRWIASDAIRELEKYLKEGRIKKVGVGAVGRK